jgi:large subunit ribosomal protein L19
MAVANWQSIVEAPHRKQTQIAVRSGDVVRVWQKIVEGDKERLGQFEGIVLRVRGDRGTSGSFTVRRVIGGIGIERVFPLHSPMVVKVEKLKSLRTRQSRLYYLRNLTDKQIRRRTELADLVVWEDAKAKEEEEKIKAEQEAEAATREAEKAAEESEAEAKVAAAKAQHVAAEGSETEKTE